MLLRSATTRTNSLRCRFGRVELRRRGGSGLPGNHIGGLDSYVNLFAGGSLFGPRTGNETVVDGYSAIRGPIEDGLGLRINIGDTDCEFFDLHFYGITEQDVTQITEGIRITT